LLNSKKPDFILVREVALITESFNQQGQQRFKVLVQNLILIIYKFHGTDDSEWYCAMEQIINTVFNVNKNPENISQFILLKLSNFFYTDFPSQQIQYPDLTP
jgi:condensin complex subunit 1